MVADGLWRTSLLVFTGTLIARALGFLFPIVIAHAASKNDFASVFFFINTGFFVSELVLTGYPTALARAVAAEKHAALRGTWLSASAVGGLPLLALSITAGEILTLAVNAALFPMVMVVVGLTFDAYYFQLLRGLSEFRLLVTYRISANAIQILLLILLIAAGAASVATLVALYSFVYLIPMLWIELRWSPGRCLLRKSYAFTIGHLKLLTRFAVPSLISGTAYATIFGLDVFFVLLFAPNALADYAAARAITAPITMLPRSIGTVLLPRVASASDDEAWPMLFRALITSSMLVVCAVGTYSVFSPTIISVVFPPNYAPAAEPLRIIAPALGALAVYSIMSQWWMGRGRPVAPAVSIVSGAMVASASHLVLTSAHGAIGASFAILAGISTALVVLGVHTINQARRRVNGA